MVESANPWSNRVGGRGDAESVGEPLVEAATSSSDLASPRYPAFRRGKALVIGAVTGAMLIVALCAAIVGLRPATVSDAAPTTTTTVFVNRGLTLGRVIEIHGKILEVESPFNTTVVETNADTNVLVLSGSNVSDIAVGDYVFVHGDRWPDGRIVAKLIVGG